MIKNRWTQIKGILRVYVLHVDGEAFAVVVRKGPNMWEWVTYRNHTNGTAPTMSQAVADVEFELKVFDSDCTKPIVLGDVATKKRRKHYAL